MTMPSFECRMCGGTFTTEKLPRGQKPFWCGPCRVIARRERARQDQARYRAANPERYRQYGRDYYKRSPEVARHWQLWTKYRITLAQYEELVERQGGRCALCGTDDPGRKTTVSWNVDHDHGCCPTQAKSCGKCVRGLLCRSCNSTLLPGYEALPERLRDSSTVNAYLASRVEFDPFYRAALTGGN